MRRCPCFRIDGPWEGSWAGIVVAGGRDIDDDGFDDLAVGAPLWVDPDYTNGGGVGLFYGGLRE